MIDRMSSINPAILIWARETSGTTKEEARRKFGEKQLDAWESGEEYPTYSQLKTICEFYRKPVAVCFFPEPPVLKNLRSSCRTLPNQLNSVFTRNLLKCIDEARVMQLNLYELHDGANPAGDVFNKSKFDINSIQAAARQLRALLGAPLEEQKKIGNCQNAFEYWRDKFFSAGIFVFKDAFKDENVSGFCLYDDIFPIIYVNNSFALSRQIFTLFHEAFHLIAHTSGIDIINDKVLYGYATGSNAQIERYCNQFASAVLVPESDFSRTSNDMIPTDENVLSLANTYCVSREVILRKYLDSKRISIDEYNLRSAEYTADYFRSKGNQDDGKNKGNYYNTQATYKGIQYLRLAFTKYYSKQISITQLSKYMNMKISSIQTLAKKKGWGTL